MPLFKKKNAQAGPGTLAASNAQAPSTRAALVLSTVGCSWTDPFFAQQEA